MNTIQKLLLLLLSVPCAYTMQRSNTSNDINLLADRVTEKHCASDSYQREPVRGAVVEALKVFEKEKADADCGDGPAMAATMVALGMAAGGVASPYYGDARGLPAGAIIALWIWAERNPAAADAICQKVEQYVQRLRERLATGIEAKLSRNPEVLFELLAASNTF